MSEWQPIETAPKDGTHIILTGDDIVAEDYWMKWRVDDTESWAHFQYVKPTHWMPLPTPPKP